MKPQRRPERLPKSNTNLEANRVLPLFWVEPKVFRLFLLFASVSGAFGVAALLQGIWQLHYTLNPRSSGKVVTATAPVSVSGARTQALPAPSVRGSITEGTTELLVSMMRNDRTAEPVSKVHDTAEVDDERLM